MVTKRDKVSVLNTMSSSGKIPVIAILASHMSLSDATQVTGVIINAIHVTSISAPYTRSSSHDGKGDDLSAWLGVNTFAPVANDSLSEHGAVSSTGPYSIDASLVHCGCHHCRTVQKYGRSGELVVFSSMTRARVSADMAKWRDQQCTG